MRRFQTQSLVSPYKRVLYGALLAIGLLSVWPAVGAQPVLAPEQAFRATATMVSPDTLVVTWRIADHHYMYRQRFSVRAVGDGVVLGKPAFPAGITKQDPYFGEVEIYRGTLTFTVPVSGAEGLSVLSVKALGQGCNEQVGICYPPVTRTLTVSLNDAGPTAPQSSMTHSATGTLGTLQELLDGGDDLP